MKCNAIITAGGIGKRFPGTNKKQFIEIKGRPVLIWAVEKFFLHPEIESIFVTVPGDSLSYTKTLLDRHFKGKNIVVVRGGETRQESVFNALSLIASDTSYVLIHDGVRPLISTKEIDTILKLVLEHRAVIPGHRVKNTIKDVRDNKVYGTVPRENLYEVYTPQVFSYDLILECHRKAREERREFTDDAGILEYYGHTVYVADTSAYNIKITEPADYDIVGLLIKRGL